MEKTTGEDYFHLLYCVLYMANMLNKLLGVIVVKQVELIHPRRGFFTQS